MFEFTEKQRADMVAWSAALRHLGAAGTAATRAAVEEMRPGFAALARVANEVRIGGPTLRFRHKPGD